MILNEQNIINDFCLHYGIKDKDNPHSLKLETFAKTACAISAIIKEIGYLEYPDFNLEVHIEAFNGGSFLSAIKIRRIARKIKSTVKNKADEHGFEKKDTANSLIYPAIAGTISTALGGIILYAFLNNNQPTVINNITVNGDNNTVTIEKDAQAKAQNFIKNPNIKCEIDKIALAIIDDKNVKSFGFTKDKETEPYICIPREDIEKYYHEQQNIETESKINNEEEKDEILPSVKLHLPMARLDKDKKDWFFETFDSRINQKNISSKKQIKKKQIERKSISAPILDDDFYSKIISHKINFEHGDSILVNLRQITTYDKTSGIITKTKYEVVKVIEYHKTPEDDLFKNNYPNNSLG